MPDEKPTSAKATAGKEELNIEELKKQFEECQKQKDEYLAGWQRARADFLNYKKETAERIEELLEYTAEELILKILPILDNFEIAEKKLPDALKGEENPEGEPSVPYGASVKGFLQIKSQLENFLRDQGVEEIKVLGERFDPNLMEIIEQVEVKDKQSGVVIEEIQKGYKINGRILRPAKVKVVK